MSMINSTGFYRGRIVDHGIGTIGDMELPQWNANLLAVEKYDADLDDWVDWAPYEELLIQGVAKAIIRRLV